MMSWPAGVLTAVGRAVRGRQGNREVWRGHGRRHIAVRGVTQERGADLAAAVEAELERHPAVRWAAVNAALGVVVVACDDGVPSAELIGIVELIESDHAAQPEAPADRPALVDRVPGAAATLAASVAGLSLASAGLAFKVVRLPAELGSLVQFVDTQPRLRAVVERAAGYDRAEVLIAAGNALAQSAAQGVGGLALDVGQRVVQLAEAVLQRGSWARAEPVLCGDRKRAAARPVIPERPRPLPQGPVERYSERIGLGAAGAFGGVLLASGSPRRAAGVALAGLPKAARLGREGFATMFGGLAARRGGVVTDHRVLRKLDRIDAVVIDADVLTTGALVVADIVPVGGASAAAVTGTAHALFSAERIGEVHADGDFRLGPLDALDLRGVTGVRVARRMTRGGAVHVLGLARGRKLQAVVSVVGELAAGADLLLAAARRADAKFLLAVPAGARTMGPGAAVTTARQPVAVAAAREHGSRGAAGFLADGPRLVASVRGLQADGAAVLLVSRRRRALAAADCGVGLASPDGRPAWGAHILAGDDLALAALVIDAVRVARSASRRGVTLAQAAAALGATLALGGSAPGAAGRSLLAVNGAGAIALATGAWQATELARRPGEAPRPQPPWHLMPADVVLERLGSQPGGLSGEVAARRWQQARREPQRPSLPRAFAAELANPLTPILAGGAALSASIGAITDAAIITAVGGLSALTGGVQRVYTDRSMARLFKASSVTARVLRDGAERSVAATDVVVGDIVLLGAGDVVPADCRLLDAQALQVDESSLTGESFPVDKKTDPVAANAIAERRSMIYEGTTIAAGHATACVVAVGDATEQGRSLAGLAEAAPVTGVEARLAKITGTTLPLALGSAAAVVAAGLLRGRPATDTARAAVGLAVASVPEGLPFLVTAAQLAAARRLAGRGALVRNPRTIEALGRANVLCFDKTGTLTQGHLAVAAVCDGAATGLPGALGEPGRQVLAAALRATPGTESGGTAEHMTDEAVTSFATAEAVTRSDGCGQWWQVDALPFEPSRAYHATLASTGDGPLLSVKGAPELILPLCTRWRGRSLSQEDRNLLRAALDRLARDGHRVLAVAEDRVAAGYQLSGDLRSLSFTGFLAFGDPVRAAAATSVRQLREAGVHIVMITGDHPATAAAVAAKLNVLNGGTIVTGTDLDALPDANLSEVLADATVIARCTPEHKVRVVRAYQAAGRVVAMTGDGANDAAAIRLADVGIALGKRGTPAARAAADLVVTDDRLETILSAIVEGRAMWRSVRQAIGILVGGNVGEIGFTLLGALLTGASPLSARQLLLVNLLTDLAPAVAIAVRGPGDQIAGDLLAEGPDSSLGSALTDEIAIRAVATGAAASGAWLAGRMTGRAARARTIGLAALVGTELGQTLLVGGRNPLVAAASLMSTGVLVGVVQTPGVSEFFDCTPLGPVGWSIAAGCSIAATGGSLLLPRLRPRLTPVVASLSSVVQDLGSVIRSQPPVDPDLSDRPATPGGERQPSRPAM
jgi:cation-transporting P-type ATPase I